MRYHVTYSLEKHAEGIPREQVPEGHGGASALVLVSVIVTDDGSTSYQPIVVEPGPEVPAATLLAIAAALHDAAVFRAGGHSDGDPGGARAQRGRRWGHDG